MYSFDYTHDFLLSLSLSLLQATTEMRTMVCARIDFVRLCVAHGREKIFTTRHPSPVLTRLSSEAQRPVVQLNSSIWRAGTFGLRFLPLREDSKGT